MDEAAKGQVSRSAAEVYEEFFVPALFQQWAPRVADAAQLAPGQKVLDVGCGTGVLAREAVLRVRPGGSVVGLDRNEGMLAVARRAAPDIEWRQGMAEALPFDEGAFDAVVSQFGLMFFEDRAKALREMWRVLPWGGRLAVAVWDELDHSPGYAAMTRLLQRLFGSRIADALRAPFALGEPQQLPALLGEAGISGAEIRTMEGAARFPSIEAWIATDVKGWTLADLIDDAQYRLLLREGERELQAHVGTGGAVAFAAPAHIATAVKP
jgi:ubiquinone/menaquinone biosynthesis C-methylase UbiE